MYDIKNQVKIVVTLFKITTNTINSKVSAMDQRLPEYYIYSLPTNIMWCIYGCFNIIAVHFEDKQLIIRYSYAYKDREYFKIAIFEQ